MVAKLAVPMKILSAFKKKLNDHWDHLNTKMALAEL